VKRGAMRNAARIGGRCCSTRSGLVPDQVRAARRQHPAPLPAVSNRTTRRLGSSARSRRCLTTPTSTRAGPGRTAGRGVARGRPAAQALLRARTFHLVVVHMEALPYLPAFYERLLAGLGVPFVYEFDDASFHQYDCSGSRIVAGRSGQDRPRHRARRARDRRQRVPGGYARRFNPGSRWCPRSWTCRGSCRAAPRGLQARSGGWIGSPPPPPTSSSVTACGRELTSSGQVALRLVGLRCRRPRRRAAGHGSWNEATRLRTSRASTSASCRSRRPVVRGKCASADPVHGVRTASRGRRRWV